MRPEQQFRSSIIWLLLIFFVGLGLRLHAVLSVPVKENLGLGSFVDSFLYNTIAYNLSCGRGFTVDIQDPVTGETEYRPEFSRGPGYPLFLAAVYSVSRGDAFSVYTLHKVWDKARIAQCLLDAFCTLLVFGIAFAVYGSSPLPALFSAGLYSLSTYNIYYTRTILSEPLAAFLATAFVFFAVKALKSGERKYFLTSGALLGSLILTRPEYMLFPAVFLCVIPFCLKKGKAWVRVASFIAGCALVVFPWSIRNLAVFKKPVLVSAGGLGESIYFGTFIEPRTWNGFFSFPDSAFNSQGEKNEFLALRKVYPRKLAEGTIPEVNALDRRYIDLALKRISAKPLDVLRVWALKTFRLWHQFDIRMYRDPQPPGGLIVFIIVLAGFSFIGQPGVRVALMLPVALLCVYLTVLFIPLHVESRYSVVLIPAITGLSGIGIMHAARWVQRMQSRIIH